jgi:hypothetical protein
MLPGSASARARNLILRFLLDFSIKRKYGADFRTWQKLGDVPVIEPPAAPYLNISGKPGLIWMVREALHGNA